MPSFRVHRMKEGPREQFRWAAHTGGLSMVKPKDYEAAGQIEAVTPYAAWKLLGERNDALQPGDLLEVLDESGAPGELRIAKYIGFEPAQWFVSEPKAEAGTALSYTALPQAHSITNG